ncbi:porin family protein [Hymenobacter sp. 5317J-9]|uniref:outer membrane beta-barrel protein n=1 Tax=Hymenobacter sp. 5317J-9 TaxID=2932250 RepID=UPI001FD6F2EF|nr:outer membrane beta-barrel protein [Hymenobacter sp. 5317J-9]UOQ99513.1 porin family protein [Hymenobacter sp. 5317J-9]
MLAPRLALGTLLLALPCLSRAQTTEPAPVPKFYVGLGAYGSFYQSLGGRFSNEKGFPVPLQLTAGYQLRPRLAVQLGVAYSGFTSRYDVEGYYFTADPAAPEAYYHYTSTSTRRNTSVSALARYTLTRKLAHRVQFDVLGGLTLEHYNGYARGTETQGYVNNLQVTNFDQRYVQNTLLLSAGASVRYRLTPRFDLNLDYTLNHSVLTGRPSRGLNSLTGAAALGLRYRFGQR